MKYAHQNCLLIQQTLNFGGVNLKIGCCTDIKNYDYLVDIGVDYIELSGSSISAMTDEQFNETLSKIQNGKIKALGINAYCPPDVIIAGPNFDPVRAEEYAKKTISRIDKLNIKKIGIGSPNSRNIPENFSRATAISQLKEFLKINCNVASEYGINILFEAVCTKECNFINTSDEALQIVKELDINNLFMVFDIYHVHTMGEPLNNLDNAFKYIKHLHISQDVNNKRGYLDNEHLNEYKVYIDRAKKLGYDDTISVEAITDDFKTGMLNSLSILKKLTE